MPFFLPVFGFLFVSFRFELRLRKVVFNYLYRMFVRKKKIVQALQEGVVIDKL